MKRLIVEPPLAFEEAAAWATDDELAAARGFAPARGREYLAWRAVVRREIGRDAAIAYNAAGAPVLTNYPLHLSISHCRGAADCRKRADNQVQTVHSDDGLGRVAVAISDAPCAVDIEPVSRDFRRAMPRYLSPSEQRLSDNPIFPAIAWCAKETLFKYAASTMDAFKANRNGAASAGGRPLDLLRDLHIDRVQFPDASDTSASARPASSPVSADGIPNSIPCGTLFARILNDEPVVLRFYEHEGFAVVFLFGQIENL